VAKTEDILKERGQTYGNYSRQAAITRNLNDVLEEGMGKHKDLEHDQLDALYMVCVKLARIVNGNPNHIDNWRDIAGYATLVADRLEKENE